MPPYKHLMLKRVFHLFVIFQYLRDENDIEQETANLCSYLTSRQLYGLYRYFHRQYLTRPKECMRLYRCDSTVSTNMHLESFHRLLKHSFLSRSGNIRLDSLIQVLFDILERKVSNLYIAIERGVFRNHRLLQNADEHRKATLIFHQSNNNVTIRQNGFQRFILHLEGEMFTIRRVQQRPCCLIVRKRCKICQHVFACDCHTPRFKSPVCVHVHLLCLGCICDFPY